MNLAKTRCFPTVQDHVEESGMQSVGFFAANFWGNEDKVPAKPSFKFSVPTPGNALADFTVPVFDKVAYLGGQLENTT